MNLDCIILIIALILLVALTILVGILLWKQSQGGAAELKERLIELTGLQRNVEELLGREFARNREESRSTLRESRQEQAESLEAFGQRLRQQAREESELQRADFKGLLDRQRELKQETEQKLDSIRNTLEQKLEKLREENKLKLEEMRQTVDEKLEQSLEKRFTQSFKLISERLEEVQKGLGEMQSLAAGVGDLKRVLSNVKTRGTLGEIQLGSILEQILSPEQYERNAAIKPNTQERVEFAIRLPGRRSDDEPVLLPIDSKFPIEDYQRLCQAYESSESIAAKELEMLGRQFESAVRKAAQDIQSKYIYPPHSTDFAILFVPSEGIYAEILRRPGLFETLQRQHKITVVGPSNLVAFLSSLQMGFRTLAIEKRSSEVWELLSAIKTQFGNFEVVLAKTRKKLQEASNVIDRAEQRTRVIGRKLRQVQELEPSAADALLGEPDEEPEAESID